MQAAAPRLAVGIFIGRAKANQAIDNLCQAGFDSKDIGVVSCDAGGNPVLRLGNEPESDWLAKDGCIAGLVAGAGVGGMVGVGVASGVLPVIGPAIAAGSLAIVLDTAGCAAVGGLAGALIGWGLPDTLARYYEKETQPGDVLVFVKSAERYEEAQAILRETADRYCGLHLPSDVPMPSGPNQTDQQFSSETRDSGLNGASGCAA